MSQTHGMRSQKFGVEIETKGVDLAEAARVIAGAPRANRLTAARERGRLP